MPGRSRPAGYRVTPSLRPERNRRRFLAAPASPGVQASPIPPVQSMDGRSGRDSRGSDGGSPAGTGTARGLGATLERVPRERHVL